MKSDTLGAFDEMELSLETSHPNSSQVDGGRSVDSTVRYREEDKFIPKQKVIDMGDDDDLPGIVYKATTVAPSESKYPKSSSHSCKVSPMSPRGLFHKTVELFRIEELRRAPIG